MVKYIKYTPELSNNWSRAWSETYKQRPWQTRRLLDSSTASQVQSKIWLVSELQKQNLKFKNVCLIGGWFAQFITPLMFDNFDINFIHNYEIDIDAKLISYKFNRRYKENDRYKAINKNLLIHPLKEKYDLIINTSCEHMYPMKKFRELNPDLKSWFVLQSTNEDKFDDHINCVNNTKELSDQGNFKQVLYEGQKVLDNGMTRFMVIGM